MGHFSNGSEFHDWVHGNCTNCRFYRLDEDSATMGCPITDAHFFLDGKGERFLLDRMIPVVDKVLECYFRTPKEEK